MPWLLTPGRTGEAPRQQRKASVCPAARADGTKIRISPGSPSDRNWSSSVAYEHMQGDRFRHLAHFRRWRLDKSPADCTYAQLEVVPPQELMAIFPVSSEHGV